MAHGTDAARTAVGSGGVRPDHMWGEYHAEVSTGTYRYNTVGWASTRPPTSSAGGMYIG
jgi:hypothetical protein